jgi:hypothetical protein
MKRILSILICLSLMFSFIPSGFAEEVYFLPQTPDTYAASDFARYAAKMAVGETHTAVIKADGTVAVWGDNTYGQLDVPAGLTGVKAVAAGSYHTLALQGDGTLVGWGSVMDQFGNPSSYTIPSDVQGLKVKSIAAGGNMSAAITEAGEVVVWGRNTKNLANVPAGLGNVVAIAINNNYAVALNDAGSITVWGRDTNVPAGLDGNAVAVAAGGMHWLALKKDGTVAIGGFSSHVNNNKAFVEALENVRAITGGIKVSVALLADGTIKGVCMAGEINAINGLSGIKAISGAPTGETVCALRTDGTLFGWSRDDADYSSKIPGGLNLLTLPSSNADLNNLSVASTVYSVYYDLVPAFDPAVTAYTVNVPSDVTGVDITATTADDKASLKINGSEATSSVARAVYGLNEGENPVAVEVTAEDGTVKTYTLAINRAASGGGGDTTQNPPFLTADTFYNNVGQAVCLTFTDDEAWRAAITGISVNGSALTGSQYSIDAGTITINAGVFTSAGDYSIVISATGYDDAALTQHMNGMPLIIGGAGVTAPVTLSYEELQNMPQIQQIFSSIDCHTGAHHVYGTQGVKLSDILAKAELKSNTPYQLKFIGGDGYNRYINMQDILDSTRYYFPSNQSTGGTPVVPVIALKYNGSDNFDGMTDQNCPRNFHGQLTFDENTMGYWVKGLAEIDVVPVQTPPSLTATPTTLGRPVTITFTDDEAWRDAITGISIKGSGISTSQYSITPGAITINAGVFSAAGDYPVTVQASGKYLDVTVHQQINDTTGGGGDVGNEFNISNVRLLNPLNNEEIHAVVGQSGYRIQARVDNNGQAVTDGLVIVQVRNGTGATADSGGKVLNCVGVASGIPATGSVVTTDYVLPGGLSGKAYVDVFVWNGWDDQIPLADSHHDTSFNVLP